MIRTWYMNISHKKQPELWDYCHEMTSHTKELRNTALFLERNIMTGLKKDPSSRYPLENEAIDTVMTGLARHNEKASRAREEFLLSPGYLELSGEEAEDAKKKFFSKHAVYKVPTAKKWFISKPALTTILQETNNKAYYALPGQVNQRAVEKTTASMKGFFSSMKSWVKDKSGFTGKPELPGYINTAESTASFSNQVCKINTVDKKQYLQFPKTKVTLCLGHTNYPGKLQSVEIIPYNGSYRIALSFKDTSIKEIETPVYDRAYVIDPGERHLLTVTSNFDRQPFSIEGEFLKDWNKLFCKSFAKMKSQLMTGQKNSKGNKIPSTKRMKLTSAKHDNRMTDGMYKAAHCLCRRGVADHVTVIVCGRNKGWKDGADLHDKETTGLFVQLPHTRFYSILQCVALKYGIAVVEQEESYTSKADFLSGDYIPTYGVDDDKAQFSGTRDKDKNIYHSKNGVVLDADVNGAANILRKHKPDAFDGTNPKDWLLKPVERILRDSIYKKRPKHGSSVLPAVSQLADWHKKEAPTS